MKGENEKFSKESWLMNQKRVIRMSANEHSLGERYKYGDLH